MRWVASWSGAPRPTRLRVGRTGGDLSLPEEVKVKVMPKAFPILEDQLGWADLVARIGTPPSDGGEAGAAGSAHSDLTRPAAPGERPSTFAG